MLDYHEMMIIVNQMVFQRQMDLIRIIANVELDCNELKEFYVDNGYSGTDFDRPGFNKLLDDITQGKINKV